MSVVDISDFIPMYPGTEDPGFYQIIYSKKEFNEYSYPEGSDLDEGLDEEGDEGSGYRPMKHQIVGSRYVSPYTTFDRLLVNHEMGTGKCVLPGTRVLVMIEGTKQNIPIDELWRDYIDTKNLVPDEMEHWAVPEIDLFVYSFTEDDHHADIKKVIHIYRQFINEDVITFKTANKTLSMTKAHKVLTIDGWKSGRDFKCNEAVATYSRGSIVYEPIRYFEVKSYSGYVYDLEVDEYHTYAANEIITHNTCYAIEIIKNIKNNDPSITKAIVLSNNERLLSTFKDQVLNKCGDIDEHDAKKFYVYDTYSKFAKKILIKPDSSIHQTYSNSVIVLDEVHHLHEVKEGLKAAEARGAITYQQIKRFLHEVDNTRQILLTGTPMRNDPTEIADTMNLILPLNRQIQKDEFFVKSQDEEDVWNIDPAKIDEFKSYFRGNVTYLRADTSEVEVVHIGQNEELSKGFEIKWTLHNNVMSNLQTMVYKQAHDIDDKTSVVKTPPQDPAAYLKWQKEQKSKKSIYSNSVQASLCVFENDKKWTSSHLKTRNEVIQKEVLKLKKSSTKSAMDFAKEHSATYFEVLNEIYFNKKELAFVYCNLVEGSGLNAFTALLSGLEYIDANKSSVINEGISKNKSVDDILDDLKVGVRRFLHIKTPKEEFKSEMMKEIGKKAGIAKGTTAAKTVKLLEIFNHPRNRTGEYIQVIIGSKLVEEGYSFKNIRQIHITTPFWNWAETSQAIARGLRSHSHDDLINDPKIPKTGIDGRLQVRLFLHAAIPNDPNVISVDLRKYELSTKKDNSIQQVKDIIRTMSFDCQLSHGRNSGEDDYKCEGITKVDLEPQDIDYSTKQLFYSNRHKLVSAIRIIFKETDSVDIADMIQILRGTATFKNMSYFEILNALNNLVFNNLVIINRYGLECYLKEFNNVYFLSPVTSISGVGDKITNLISYYSQNPSVIKSRNQRDIIADVYIENVLQGIESFGISNANLAKALSPELTEYIIERAVQAEDLYRAGKIPASEDVKIILERYKNYIKVYGKNGDLIASSYLSDMKRGPLRCFPRSTRVWEDCTPKSMELIKTTAAAITDKVYGKYVPDKKGGRRFTIVYTKNPSGRKNDKGVDKRTINRGKACVSYKKDDLKLLMMELNIGEPAKDLLKSPEELRHLYDSMIHDSVDKPPFDDLSDEKLKLLEYWLSMDMSMGQMCEIIRKHLEDNGLVQN